MTRLPFALILACFLFFWTSGAAYANDDYLVPITVGGKTFTLTVSVGATGVGVRVSDPSVVLGAVTKLPKPEEVAAHQDLESRKAQAVAIPYDDLFRYNERHVGKTVRYVGKVLQVQEKECLIFCDENDRGYILRVAVTRGSYGFWDDPIWVDYLGTQRFLEDDIVTVWGVVEGLQKIHRRARQPGDDPQGQGARYSVGRGRQSATFGAGGSGCRQ